MKGNFLIRICITSGIIASLLLMVACAVEGAILLGMRLMAICLVLLVVVVFLLSRLRRNDEDLEPLNDAGRVARFVKSDKTKPVYEHDAGIWDQMTAEQKDT